MECCCHAQQEVLRQFYTEGGGVTVNQRPVAGGMCVYEVQVGGIRMMIRPKHACFILGDRLVI